jgi:heat shock protein HspQ
MKKKRMTVGSLVRHKQYGTIGLIIDHFMWYGNTSRFEVEFTKPAKWSDGHSIKSIIGARSDFELIN